MINRNRGKGYNLGLWNCRRGLIGKDKIASTKMVEVKQFLQKKNHHMLCLVESDLHGLTSRQKKLHPLTTKEINQTLEIPGYKIILPKSWQVHGQARVLVIAKEELQVKIRDTGIQNSDLPTITCEISLGREKKTLVNYFYREFTSGVSGLSDKESQTARLSRQIRIWRSLCSGNKDVICLGDANLCAKKLHDENYQHREHAEMVQNFLLETGSSQKVKNFTRSEFGRGGELYRSLIDHCYTNVPEKVSDPEVISVENSDHLGLVVTKLAKTPVLRPRTVKKRNYKFFNVEHFLTDILKSDINQTVTACDELEVAAEMFETKFKVILDNHAPVKTYQMRTNYSPFLSVGTKISMAGRDLLREEAIKLGSKEKTAEVKTDQEGNRKR